MSYPERSDVVIRFEDLKRLQEIAFEDLENFITRKPEYKPFKKKLLFIGLCQGAGQHYLDRKHGVNDFDVWFFFKESKKENFPYRRSKKKESGLEKFGADPSGKYKTRVVELRGREIPTKFIRKGKSDPGTCLELWFNAAETDTAKHLADEAVVGLWPDNMIGKILWSP